MGRLIVLYAFWAGFLLTFLGKDISGHGAVVLGRSLGTNDVGEKSAELGSDSGSSPIFSDNRIPIESHMGDNNIPAVSEPWQPPKQSQPQQPWKPWKWTGGEENETEKHQQGQVRQISLNYPEGFKGCWVEIEAKITVVSAKKGKMLVSWTEICRKKVGEMRGQRYARGEQDNRVDGGLGCYATTPCFAFDEDDMAILLGSQIDKIIGETSGSQPGCVAVYYRYAELEKNNSPEFAGYSSGTGYGGLMWPGMKMM